MAKYLLDTVHYSGSGKILFMGNDPREDYLRACTFIGLKELLGDRIIDFPKIEYMYKSYTEDVSNLYGLGFTYTKVIDDIPVDRSNIEHRILATEFDLVIYPSVHRDLYLNEFVRRFYRPDQVIYMCCEDLHECEYLSLPIFFLREFEGNESAANIISSQSWELERRPPATGD